MALRGFVAFLLVLFIALSFTNYMFLELTEHDTGKQIFSELIAERLEEQMTDEDLLETEAYVENRCKEQQTVSLELTRNPIEIRCEDTEDVPFKIALAGAIYDQEIYYKDYDCNLFDCLWEQETFPAMLSAQAREKYEDYMKYLVIIIIILAVLLFFVSEGWTEKAGSFGYVCLISGLGAIPLLFTQRMFSQALESIKISFYIQIVLLIAGIALLLLASELKKRRKKKLEVIKDGKNNS